MASQSIVHLADIELNREVIRAQEALDRPLLYETHLIREIDRILNRLEQVQRMRKRQPLAPQLDIKIS